jgi:uncharacterized protein (TIGR03663 family)
MRRWLGLGLVLLVAAGGMVLRLPGRDQRPMHTDEAVHAIKFLGLWEGEGYRYDPHEYHGPLLYYATLPVAWASGASGRGELTESTLRLVPILFGVLLVGMVYWARAGMGWGGALWGAGFTAVSPVMVFYSRYYIHETLLVVLTFGFLVCGWRYMQSLRRGWMVGAGLCLGLMHATKETCVFVVGAAVVGWGAAWVWGRLRCEPAGVEWGQARDWGWGIGAAVVVSTVLFTSFFQNWQGPLDAWRTYGPWLARAEGQSPHVHPWHYYWSLLLFTRRASGPLWTEGIILVLGLVGMVGVLGQGVRDVKVRSWGRLLTFYTLGLSLIYTVIPYKTPWCVMGFWHGWILLAGMGAGLLVGWVRGRLLQGAVVVVLLGGMLHLGLQAHRASYRYADSRRNPWVYAHTLESVLGLVERVKAIAAVSPEGTATVVKVMADGGDYWPLPWYLREFRRTGWYAGVPVEPAEVRAPILIASPGFESAIRESLGEGQQALGMFGLRPAVFLQLHVERGLWQQFLERDRSGTHEE